MSITYPTKNSNVVTFTTTRIGTLTAKDVAGYSLQVPHHLTLDLIQKYKQNGNELTIVQVGKNHTRTIVFVDPQQPPPSFLSNVLDKIRSLGNFFQ